METEVVVFDLGKVIFDFDLNILCNSLAEYSTVKEKFKDIENFVFNHDDLFFAYEKGEISSFFLFKEIQKYLNLNISYDEFKTKWNDIFTPITDTMNIVTAVSQKYKTAILSNTNELHFDFLKETNSDFFKNFDSFFLSHELHLRKPDIKIYQKITDYYKIKPEQVFFTDDVKVNVDSARNMGIKAHLFVSPDKLKKDLACEGIQI